MQNSIEFCRILHFPEYENGLEMVDPVMAVGIFRHKMFSGYPSIKIKSVAHCGFQKKELFLMNYYQYSKLQNQSKNREGVVGWGRGKFIFERASVR